MRTRCLGGVPTLSGQRTCRSKPKTRADCVLELGRNAFNYSLLARAGFEALADLVTGCSCYDLIYGERRCDCRVRRPCRRCKGVVMRNLLAQTLSHPGRLPDLDMRGWETLLAQAWRSGLIARLAQHLTDVNRMAAVPPRPREYLEARCAPPSVRSRRYAGRPSAFGRRWLVWTRRSGRLLKYSPCPGTLASGQGSAVFGRRLHGPARPPGGGGGRAAPRRMVREARDHYTQRFYREWMHELPPMRHVRLGSAIDVHHTITPPTSHFNVDGDLLLPQCVSVEGSGRLQVLGPADMVLHSAVHLFQEGDFGHGLRDMLDMNDLVGNLANKPAFGNIWSSAHTSCVLASRCTTRSINCSVCSATGVPDHVAAAISAMRPGALPRRAMGRLLSSALRPDHPSCDSAFTSQARWLLYVRAHYLRMPIWRAVPHLLRKAWKRQFPGESSSH